MTRLALLLVLVTNTACVTNNATDRPIDPTDSPIATPTPLDAWAPFQKHGVVWRGNDDALASDPSVVREADELRMFTTCFAAYEPPELAICEARSADGVHWEHVQTVLTGRPGAWDEQLESPAAFRIDGTLHLLYAGYRTEPQAPLFVPGFPASLGVAVETADGFERSQSDAVLTPGSGLDRHAVYSPSVAVDGSTAHLLYAGHAYCDEPVNCPGVTVLEATSTPADPHLWLRNEAPILGGGPEPWRADGAAEPAIAQGPDGRWYLFFTGLAGERRSIGVAVGTTPEGPWTVNPQAILTPEAGIDPGGCLAPTVLIDEAGVRVWYLAVNGDLLHVGYATAPWPFAP